MALSAASFGGGPNNPNFVPGDNAVPKGLDNPPHKGRGRFWRPFEGRSRVAILPVSTSGIFVSEALPVLVVILFKMQIKLPVVYSINILDSNLHSGFDLAVSKF